jgi:hypothetical protein
VTRRLLALAALSVAALATAASGSAKVETTAPPEVISVTITITDSSVRMAPRVAQRGAIARFTLVNLGKKPHTFVLGHLRHGSGEQTGFKKALKPNERSILILFLDYRGTIPYGPQLPADKAKPKMKGTFKIV